jgi:HPt (histidine-containing phosphotransfer) domain-containing protein
MKVIDKNSFLDTFQYFDKPIVLEIIDIFINEYPNRISNIKNAIDTKNFDSLKFDAHSMKGVISNFMAAEPQKFARELENKAVEKDDSNLDDIFNSLHKSSEALLEDLKELRLMFEEE